MTNKEILIKALEIAVQNGFCQDYFAIHSAESYINSWYEFAKK